MYQSWEIALGEGIPSQDRKAQLTQVALYEAGTGHGNFQSTNIFPLAPFSLLMPSEGLPF